MESYSTELTVSFINLRFTSMYRDKFYDFSLDLINRDRETKIRLISRSLWIIYSFLII